MTALALKNPGCFGAATVFNFDSPVCNKCHAFDECRGLSLAKLEQIKGLIDVSDLLARHENATRRAKTEPSVEVLPSRDAPEVAPLKLTKSVTPSKVKPPVVKYELTDSDRVALTALRKKPQAEMRKLKERNEDKGMLEKLNSGVNPFPLEGRRYLHVACDLLMKGGFTRTELRDAYKERLGWRVGAAASHVSIIGSLFPALGIVQEIDGRYVLTPVTA